jgi:hypothetical protein
MAITSTSGCWIDLVPTRLPRFSSSTLCNGKEGINEGPPEHCPITQSWLFPDNIGGIFVFALMAISLVIFAPFFDYLG